MNVSESNHIDFSICNQLSIFVKYPHLKSISFSTATCILPYNILKNHDFNRFSNAMYIRACTDFPRITRELFV